MNTFRKISFFAFLCFSLFTFNFSLSHASLSDKEQQEALVASNNAVGKEIGNYTLIDQDGKMFKLKDFASGKPFVINLIYTSCGHICPTITMNLKNAIKDAGRDFGVKFNAITVGFDVENDTSKRMREYGGNFTDDFKNWKFAASDKETIDKLAKDVGFYYRKIDGGFDHLNLITIIDKNGKVYRQVYGMDFRSEEVLKPVYQSGIGKPYYAKSSDHESRGIINSIVLFCYKYDEKTGQYKLDYPFLIGTALEAIAIISSILFVWGGNIKSFFARRLGH